MKTQDLSDLRQPDRAASYLAARLRDGTLVLFLGAGVSSGFGLPQWVALVNRLRKRVGLGLLPEAASSEDLQIGADEGRAKFSPGQDYRDALRSALYDGVSLSADRLLAPLMVAIGALLMGSKRGRVKRVVSFNFDSMLEWFLTMHGFVVRVVRDVPALEGDEDVRVYHPHGFIGHPSLDMRDSSDVILGLDSVHARVGSPSDPWFDTTRHLLRSGVGLFIGMSQRSFRDPSIGSLIMATGKEISLTRPTGIWIIRGNVTREEHEEFERRNVVALPLQGEAEIREFLLDVCQKAAGASAVRDS